MTDNGQDIELENVNPAVIPSESEQDFLRRVWIEALAEMLAETKSRWEDAFRTVKSEAAAAVAKLRASVGEVRVSMESMIEERLGQIRQPIDGKDGSRGEQGPRGEAGPPGKIAGVQAYVEDAIHYRGDVVVHLGGTFQAKCDTAKAPPHADWACIAAAGRDARMPKICGTYREGETYNYLDIVAMGGSSFVARADDPGPCPGDGWQLVASAGKAGKPGPKGERGESGPRGERGPPGLAAILRWQIDPERYRARPLMSDGSEGPALELRLVCGAVSRRLPGFFKISQRLVGA
jgi:hypothetical protein